MRILSQVDPNLSAQLIGFNSPLEMRSVRWGRPGPKGADVSILHWRCDSFIPRRLPRRGRRGFNSPLEMLVLDLINVHYGEKVSFNSPLEMPGFLDHECIDI